MTILPCLHKYKNILQESIPKAEVNARTHVLLWYERKEHEGCHTSVEAEIIPRIKQEHNALFQHFPDPQSIQSAFVARLCWKFVHKMATVSFDVIRYDTIQDRTRRCDFDPPHAKLQNFFVHESIEIVIAQGSGYFASVFVISH